MLFVVFNDVKDTSLIPETKFPRLALILYVPESNATYASPELLVNNFLFPTITAAYETGLPPDCTLILSLFSYTRRFFDVLDPLDMEIVFTFLYTELFEITLTL